MKRQHRGKKPEQAEYTGVIRLTARAIGYVEVPELAEDIEVPFEALNTALHRDTVRVALRPRRARGRSTGEVIEVVTRAKTRFVGTLYDEDGYRFVKPDDRKCYVDFIVERDSATAPPGDKVAVELVRWSDAKKNPLVRIVESLGPAGEHETELRSVVASQGFDWHFPEAVEDQARTIEARQEAFMRDETSKRRDFRNVPTCTIDPVDAKDFDDAISVRRLADGKIELSVHIADVSAYLVEGTAMDVEAQKRATSIYLVDRTIPMLPETLSNNLCSLVPHEDRLAFSAVFTMSLDGTVHDRWFGETVIRSARRYTYEDAQETLTTKAGDLYEELAIADTIARALRAERFKNGSIGFETDEIKFELDLSGKPIRAWRKERLDTMLLIEDLMLLANREVATWIGGRCSGKKNDCVFVWRIHDAPKPERIEELALFLKVLGYELPHKRGVVTAQAINALFDELSGTAEQGMIETATIRSMAKAIYSLKNIGHFGLAFPYYTHFTSPIRRYPDVLVHRIVKSHLNGTPVGARDAARYASMAAHSSEREVAAMEAERDSVKLKQVEFMAPKVGELFSGVVTGVNDWGVFVTEDTTLAEGLVRTSTLRDDVYELKDHGFRLVGSRSGRTLALGTRVQVRLRAVDIERKMIDWELADATP